MAGLRSGQKCISIGKNHIQQRKFMGRQGHFVGGNHVLPGNMANVGHVKTVGADYRTLPAEGAGVHGLVELVVTHDDLGVVVNLFGEKPGIFFVVSQIGTALHALFTVALDAAFCLSHSLLRRIS